MVWYGGKWDSKKMIYSFMVRSAVLFAIILNKKLVKTGSKILVKNVRVYAIESFKY